MAKNKFPYIIPQLHGLAFPVAELVPDPLNARVHPERNIQAVRTSLTTYGQRAPLIVQRDTKIVLAGNLRLELAKELGWSHVAIVLVDDDEQAARAFGLMDNKSAELAEWDMEMVANILRDLPPELMDLTGFSDFEIDPLLNADWSPPEPPKDSGSEFMGKSGDKLVKFAPDLWDPIALSIGRYREANPDAPESDVEIITLICAQYTGVTA